MNDFIKPFEQLLVFSSSVTSQAMTKTDLDISLEKMMLRSPALNKSRSAYQLDSPKPLTRPLLLKQCLPLGSTDQGTGPQLNLPREPVLSGASLCSPQWLRNRGQPAGQPAVVKVSFFHIYILARNDFFIHSCHKKLIKIDTLNMKIGWISMKIWINNKI